ncbi:T9SS type A sorting domain-containing protein [Porphyromonas endodontalis]|uniref:T9SS type A sorting domain-containing protein n=1 Tax=Porphyromonas endodontalis TaxID=28124 RepID=UPI0023F19045|nr:T9SS type A sorting domain-containing protein [Porphyromonas endodontalis]
MKLKHLMGVLLVLLLGSGIAKAQTEYGFYICGVKVNSENVKKLNEIKGVTVGAGGHISYSPETNTLSIKNVALQPERGGMCLHVYSAYNNLPFRLHLEGKNQFNSTDDRAFETKCDTRIEGSGELFIRTNEHGISVFYGATLAIEDCTLDIVSERDGGGYAGIHGIWWSHSKLVIKNASIYAKASGKEDGPFPYAIGGFESITLEGSVITQPSNAEISDYTFYSGSPYTKQFIMSGDKPATEVRIEKVIPYEFSICGVGVNSGNVKKLNEIKGVTVGAGGYISYSPETNTLSIKDVSMQAEEGERCLYVYSAYKNLPFTLHLEGKNQFNATDKTAFWTKCNTRIEGSGELFIRTNHYGIFVHHDATLAIEDCSLEIVSETNGEGYSGIDGLWDTQAKLVIKNANIYAKASGKENVPYPYAIGGFESISIEGSVITQPSNAEIGSYTFYSGGTSYTKQFVMSGDKPATEVWIERTNDLYNFSICGVAVTKRNVDKLDEIPGVTVGDNGHITYSPETNTLSIKNVSMQAEEGERCLQVYSAYKNLPFTLHLEGKNQFNATDKTAFWTKCNTRIEGSGELFIRTNHYGIFVHHDATLAIEDCSLEIVSETDGEGYTGISGYWHTQPKLVIKNASIYAKASGKEVGYYPYAIGGFESITLEGSVITQPSNAEISDYTFYSGSPYTKQFIMSGDKPATEVRIEKVIPYEFSICGVEVNSGNVNKLDKIEGVTVGAGGHITYSPETNTLSIKDVTLQTSEEVYAVYVDCQFDDRLFTLSLEGENQFNIPNFLPLYTDADMRIDGSGKLSIRTKGTGIFVANDATMTIEDCTLDIVSDTNGDGRACIEANCSERSHLMIKNASIYAKSSGKENAYYPYAIGEFESILLGGVTITEPRDGVVGSYTVQMGENYYTKQFIMSGDKPAKEVKIMKTLAVEEVDVADLRVYPNPATHYVQVEGAKAGASIALYSLEGIRLLAAEANEAGAVELDLTTLPAGNYVVKAGGKHLKLSVKH